MQPSAAIADTNTAFTTAQYSNFEQFFQSSCGTWANPNANCNEDMSNLDGNPALYNPQMYFNYTGDNDIYFFRNLNVSLDGCTASTGESTSGSGTPETTTNGNTPSTPSYTPITATVTADVGCTHITAVSGMAVSWAETTNPGYLSPGSDTSVQANQACNGLTGPTAGNGGGFSVCGQQAMCDWCASV